MRKKKLGIRKSARRKAAIQKKINRRKKPIQRKKGPSEGSSAQIHQGVGLGPGNSTDPSKGLLDSD